MRHKLLTDFQVKIAYHYRKHLKRVAEKKRIEEEKRKKRLAAAAKKKGGKKGKKGKKKAATLTPKQCKDITTVKDEKNLTELEPGVDQPTVDINVDGEPLDKDEDDEDKPGSQGSKRSKGTAEAKSDDENDETMKKTTLFDADGNPIEQPILEKESDDEGKENRESPDLERDPDAEPKEEAAD